MKDLTLVEGVPWGLESIHVEEGHGVVEESNPVVGDLVEDLAETCLLGP